MRMSELALRGEGSSTCAPWLRPISCFFIPHEGATRYPKKGGLLMKTLFNFAERLAGPLLRISLGLVLLWIGSLHLQNPQSIVVLLSLSLPFLAYSAFVYVLGALEVIAGIMLIAGLWVRYVGLLTLVLFAGTLTIFVIAPGVTGF